LFLTTHTHSPHRTLLPHTLSFHTHTARCTRCASHRAFLPALPARLFPLDITGFAVPPTVCLVLRFTACTYTTFTLLHVRTRTLHAFSALPPPSRGLLPAAFAVTVGYRAACTAPHVPCHCCATCRCSSLRWVDGALVVLIQLSIDCCY